jgi:menaquinone-dependent protoporphyrinogen oxidase
MTRILLAFASRHGSTREVAETIAAVLRERDLAVEVRSCADVDAIAGYDAVVLGAALYTGRVHADARRFLERHAGALAAKPVAVFAMGPRTLAPEEVESSREQLDRALARFPRLSPVAVAIFGGVIDPQRLHFPLNRMPAGDARDWEAIRAWAREIALALGRRLATTEQPVVVATDPA